MTPEQQAIVETVGDAIRVNPRPWSQLTTQEQTVLRAGLMPHPSFSDEQVAYLRRWWLAVAADQVDPLNALCPAHTQIAPREDITGSRYIGADLLSDALDEGRLSALLPILSTLTLTYADAIVWPVILPEVI